eukprot:3281820-Rhodomonas_salina.3
MTTTDLFAAPLPVSRSRDHNHARVRDVLRYVREPGEPFAFAIRHARCVTRGLTLSCGATRRAPAIWAALRMSIAPS